MAVVHFWMCELLLSLFFFFHMTSAIAMTFMRRSPLIKSHSRLASVLQDGSESHI